MTTGARHPDDVCRSCPAVGLGADAATVLLGAGVLFGDVAGAFGLHLEHAV